MFPTGAECDTMNRLFILVQITIIAHLFLYFCSTVFPRLSRGRGGGGYVPFIVVNFLNYYVWWFFFIISFLLFMEVFFNHQSFCHQLCFFHYTVCFFLHLQDYFTVKKKKA